MVLKMGNLEWQEKYLQCLALEFSNPEYFKVHHLLVLTYMLQTGGYSKEWFLKAVELLREFLDGSITPDSFKKQFLSMEKETGIVKFDWDLDILSVRIERPEQYIEDVERWAQDVLRMIELQRGGYYKV